MRRRLLVWAALGATWLAGTVLGTTAAALRTEPGRDLVVQAATGYLNDRIRGTFSVGAVSGSFLGGLEARDVRIVGADGEPLVETSRVAFRYRLVDLLGGRVVLGQLELSAPRINLVQREPGGPFNVDEIFPGGADGGARPFIAFRDVGITDATVVIRTPAAPADGAANGERGSDGLRVQRITGLTADLFYLRVSSPLPFEQAIRAEIASLSADVSDPAVTLVDARGVVDLWGDSLALDLLELRLPRTAGRARGTVSWPADGLRFDLALVGRQVATNDVRGLVPDVPAGLVGAGRFTVDSRSDTALAFVAEDLDLSGTGGGGRVRGRLAMVLGPGDAWAHRRTDLRLDEFDLEYVRHLLDTLPMAGRVSGRVAADGPRTALTLDLDAAFRDSLVDDWPVTRLRGAGEAAVGGGDAFVFRRFTVRTADVSLATVRRLLPAVVLEGRLSGTGSLDGPWLAPSFEGELRYADAPLPETRATGRVRLDARGDTLGAWATLAFDSLRLTSFGSTFPGFTGHGAFAGTVEIAGTLDSLGLVAELAGPSGALTARGALVVLDERRGARSLEVDARRLDLSAFDTDLPRTRLLGQGVLGGTVGSGGRSGLELVVALARSDVADLPVDSGRARLAVTDDVVRIDTLRLWSPGLRVEGRGDLGLERPAEGRFTFSARSDSLGALEPWLARVLGVRPPTDSAAPSGVGRATGRVSGSLDAFEVIADVEIERFRRGDLVVAGGGGAGAWVSASRVLRFDGGIDSLEAGGVGLGGVELHVHGPVDSLVWQGRSRFGTEGAWIGGGGWVADSARTQLRVDSLRVRLAEGVWFVDTAVAQVGDSGVDFSDVAIVNDRGAGRITVSGRVPLAGPGGFTGTVVALPVRDLWALLGRDVAGVSGEINGNVSVTGTARAPLIEVALLVRDAAFGTFRAPSATAEVRYRDRQVSGDVELRRAGETILTVALELPLDLAFTPVERRRLAGAMSVRARADGVDLGFLDALTPTVRRAAGTLDADFGIAGTWERPVLTGRIAVRDGAVTLPALGVRYEAMSGTLALSGDTVRVEDFTLRTGEGTLAVGGFVRLVELSRPELTLRLYARDFRAMDVPGFLTLMGSADLELEGPFFNATLTGRGVATRGVLYFADLITKEVVNLGDTLFAQFVDTTLLRERLGPDLDVRFLDSLRIADLRLDMGREMWLRSTEANIQLAGTVTVNKRRDQYRLNGTLQTPRGTYRLEIPPLLRRDFTVTRGEVQYFGTPDLNADLDIEARHAVRTPGGDDVTIFVHIGGTLYGPELALRSDVRPELSQTEITCYLMFRAPCQQAFAGAEAIQKQQAVEVAANMLTGRLESSLFDLGVPLDYFQIRSVGGGVLGAEIAVGKQFEILGTTAFLSANPRICPREVSALGASLEFQLTRRWLLAATVDPVRSCERLGTQADVQRYQFGLDLLWDRRY